MFLTNTCTFASISFLFENFIKSWTGFNRMFKICKTRRQVSVKTGCSEKATQYYSWVQFKQLQKKDLGIIRGFWGGISTQWNISAFGTGHSLHTPSAPSPVQWAQQWLLNWEQQWLRPRWGHLQYFHKHLWVQLHCLTMTHSPKHRPTGLRHDTPCVRVCSGTSFVSNSLLLYKLQEYWSGLPCLPPRDLPDPGIKLMSPALAGTFFTTAPQGKPISQSVSSVAQSCPTLCDPMNRSTPGLPVHHQLPEFTETHVHRVTDAIQPSHPLSFPSPPAPNPSQHRSLFQWVNSSHEVAKVLEF